jgi:CelD/BcsL family acetyltransferase involved in cellulose biosynthesis
MRPELFRRVPPGQTRVIRDVTALDGLAEAWDAIAAPAVSPMQQYAWARACAATFTGRRDLHVVAVSESVGLAVAPLVQRRDRLARVEFLGALELDEPSDVLASDEASLALLAEVLVRSGHPLLLKRIPAESPLVPALLRAYSGRGLVVRRRLSGFPWIPLHAGWTRPEDCLNAGRQSDLRRARRIAESIGAVRMEVFSPALADLGAVLAEAFAVEAAGWKGRQGSALACDPIRQAFFRRYAAAACRRGILRFGFLRIGGQTAAMQLGVEWGGRFWLLKIGFDEAFARCSPGTLLMLEMVRRAAQRGLHAYELLGVSEPWTRMWTELEHPCVSLRAYPASRTGAAALAADLATLGWRRLARPLLGVAGVA